MYGNKIVLERIKRCCNGFLQQHELYVFAIVCVCGAFARVYEYMHNSFKLGVQKYIQK